VGSYQKEHLEGKLLYGRLWPKTSSFWCLWAFTIATVSCSPPKRRHLGNKARQPARHTTSTMWHPSGAVQCAWLPGNPPDSSIYRATNVIGVDVNWLSLDATVLYSVVDGCNVAPSLNNVLCIGLPPTCMFSSVGPSRRMTGRSKRVAPLCRIYTKTQL